MDEPAAQHRPRIESEIAILEAQEALHRHGAAFHGRSARSLDPALREAFGRSDVHGIYAETIGAAVRRTGAQTVFSLGCGDGAQEVAVLRRADELGLPPFRIIGLDLAPGVVARANALAAKAGFAGRFEAIAADLNAGLPGEETVAAVMAHHALHHFVALEPIFDSVAARLAPEGVLVTFDMIGRNGHMRWPEVRPLMQQIWSLLPEAKRQDLVFGRTTPAFQDWDCAIAGFEGVRAEDILPLLDARFIPERLVAWGAFTEVFVGRRFGAHFDPEVAEDRAFLDALLALEQRLLAERQTTPTEMAAVFRPRRSSLVPDAATAEALRRALRRRGETFAALDLGAFTSPYPSPVPVQLPVLELGTRQVPTPDTAAGAALREGWEPPEADGVWAILDEQALRFATARPTRSITLRIWNNIPRTQAPCVTAIAAECPVAESGPLDQADMRDLVLRAPAPRTVWDIRLHSAAYRRPDLDGGADRRPLAYRLAGITATN